MSLPPDFLDRIRQALPLSQVIGRRTKLVRKGREMTGLCPFHNEKSPSFWVNDDKGTYYCFGCQAKGDLINFVQETERLSFMEVVERLAGEAGLEVPVASEAERRAAEARAGLGEALEAACAFYEAELQGRTPGAEAARAYLARRDVPPHVQQRFRLGYAPAGRNALREALAKRGFSPATMVEAGLLGRPEDGGAPYDYFRDRVTFPIRDLKGRVIAFGARALGDVKPKYLNSPESPLFHKRETLYNEGPARAAARDGGTLVAVEGYMDVIALAQAGFPAAVAPLGTALTEAQIERLWRTAPEPVLAFDGDAAGLNAAYKAIDRVLPLLRPGHSLRFALLPGGLDPDELIRAQGPGAFRAALEAAQPLADLLWSREAGAADLSTPERKAAFGARLEEVLRTISDTDIRRLYQDEFGRRRRALFAPPEGRQWDRSGAGQPAPFRAGGRGGRPAPFAFGGAGAALKATALAQGTPSPTREQLLLLALLNHPALLHRVHEEAADMPLMSDELDKLRCEILTVAADGADLDSGALRRHLTASSVGPILARLDGNRTLRAHWWAMPSAALVDVEKGWRHVLGRQRRVIDLKSEIDHATAVLERDMSEENLQRLLALKEEAAAAEGDEAAIEGFGAASGRDPSL
jgi:DNA primase